jgi:hypothetical protein
MEKLSRNHCYSEKSVLNILSMSVALDIQHAICMRRNLWPVCLCNISSHYLIKVCFVPYNFCLKYFSLSEELSEILS